MTNAEKILAYLDAKLNAPVELTLYGRAALLLGFENPPKEYAISRDIDGVMWLGQAEELAETTNFWQTVEEVNRELADQELYVSHFFEEDQVVLKPEWRTHRVPIVGTWAHLKMYRLGNVDLFLTKLMRDDPIDRADAMFIVERAGLDQQTIRQAIEQARVPAIREIEEQFKICAARFLK